MTESGSNSVRSDRGVLRNPEAILLYSTAPLAFAKLKAVLHLHEIEWTEPMPYALVLGTGTDLLTQALSQWREQLTTADLTQIRGVLLPSRVPSDDEIAGGILNLTDLDRLLSQLHGRWLLKLLADDAFIIVFQPLVSIRSRRTVAYECLIRAESEGGVIGAEKLLSTARVMGVTQQVDHAAWRRAIRQGRDLARLGRLLLLNFTPSSIYEPEFTIKRTIELCRENGVAPEQLVFEITEGEQVRDFNQLRYIIRDYRSEGAKVAIDDLGSGYSSVLHLAELMPDYVKLDQELVRGAHKDYVRSVLLKAVTDAAHELGIYVIAEGIETEEDLKFCIAIDADLVQGYFLARPAAEPHVVAEEAFKVLDEWVRDVPKAE